MHNKLETWIDNLDEQVIKLKKSWEEGIERTTKYQLVGDNWVKKYTALLQVHLMFHFLVKNYKTA